MLKNVLVIKKHLKKKKMRSFRNPDSKGKGNDIAPYPDDYKYLKSGLKGLFHSGARKRERAEYDTGGQGTQV